MQFHVVIQGLFDRFSPEEALKQLWNAIVGVFGDNATESLASALHDIANMEPIDPESRFIDQIYGGSFAIALVLGGLASLLWLYRAVRLHEVESWVTVIKIVPVTYVIGASLPYIAHIVTTQLGDFNAGLVGFFTDSLTGDGFDISLPGNLTFVDTLLAWLAGIFLQIEAKVMVFYLPFVLTLLLMGFGLRWFGMLGDAFFALLAGVMLVVTLGNTVIILIIGMFVFIPQRFGYEPGGTIIVFSTFLAALAPMVMLVIYYATNMSRRVHGVMESRALSARIASSDTTGQSGLSQRAYQAGAGAVAGAVMARAMGTGGRPEGVSRTSHLRSRSSDALASKAMSAAATKHPVTAIAYITGSKLLRRPNESD